MRTGLVFLILEQTIIQEERPPPQIAISWVRSSPNAFAKSVLSLVTLVDSGPSPAVSSFSLWR